MNAPTLQIAADRAMTFLYYVAAPPDGMGFLNGAAFEAARAVVMNDLRAALVNYPASVSDAQSPPPELRAIVEELAALRVVQLGPPPAAESLVGPPASSAVCLDPRDAQRVAELIGRAHALIATPAPEPSVMRLERFNELLAGALLAEQLPATMNRLSLALWFVTLETGAAGAAALERYCADRAQLDEQNGGSK